MARKYNTTYRTYKKRYYEQARKVERQKRIYQMSKTKKELIQERQAIKNARPLTKAESKYYRDEIKKNTLTKEARKQIKRDVDKLRTHDLTLRDELLDKTSFDATYEAMKKELQKDSTIQGHVDPMQYLVRQQAYAVSDKQFQALKQAVKNAEEEPYYSDDAMYTEDGEYIETYDIFKDVDLADLNEYAIRTGEVDIADFIDFDKLKEKYHQVADELKKQGIEDWSYKAKEKIGQLYWGSK